MGDGNPGNGVGVARDTKVIVYTIIATGIGIAAIVGTLVAMTYENRVDELRRTVSMEIQGHLHDMERDNSRRMDDIKNERHDIKNELRDIKNELRDIKDELRDIKDKLSQSQEGAEGT